MNGDLFVIGQPQKPIRRNAICLANDEEISEGQFVDTLFILEVLLLGDAQGLSDLRLSNMVFLSKLLNSFDIQHICFTSFCGFIQFILYSKNAVLTISKCAVKMTGR